MPRLAFLQILRMGLGIYTLGLQALWEIPGHEGQGYLTTTRNMSGVAEGQRGCAVTVK